MWQVVDLKDGTVRVCCQHRWEFTAALCSVIRDIRVGAYRHDVQWAADE